MSDHEIKPHKITKPIQLLGAWLAGLLAIDSCFLLAAANMGSSWEARALVIAAVGNVPLFLLAVFLLQTRFRPELQEDAYYSTYLNQKTNEPIKVARTEISSMEATAKVDILGSKVHVATEAANGSPVRNLLFGINKHFSDRETIKSKLADLGVLKCTMFGSDEAPEYRTVSLGWHLDQSTIDAVVALARDLGFEHYKMFNQEVEDIYEDVLFGSYGDPQYEILTGTAARS